MSSFIPPGRRIQYAWEDLVAAPIFSVGDLVYAPGYVDSVAQLRTLGLTPGLVIATNPYAQNGSTDLPCESVVSYTVLWPHTKRELLGLDLKKWGE